MGRPNDNLGFGVAMEGDTVVVGAGRGNGGGGAYDFPASGVRLERRGQRDGEADGERQRERRLFWQGGRDLG